MDGVKVRESLTASGPLAGVLGFGLVMLWRELQATKAALTDLHKEHTLFLKELLKRDDE